MTGLHSSSHETNFWLCGLVNKKSTNNLLMSTKKQITCSADFLVTWSCDQTFHLHHLSSRSGVHLAWTGETGDLHLVCHLDRDYHLGTWSLSIFVQLIQFICTKSYIIVVNEVLSILTHNVGDDNGLPIKMYPLSLLFSRRSEIIVSTGAHPEDLAILDQIYHWD